MVPMVSMTLKFIAPHARKNHDQLDVGLVHDIGDVPGWQAIADTSWIVGVVANVKHVELCAL
jgi:hypothetical protein